jgi:hypothetical protein
MSPAIADRLVELVIVEFYRVGVGFENLIVVGVDGIKKIRNG